MTRKIIPVFAGRRSVILIIICFIAYVLAYLGRLNYSAAMTEMLAASLLTKQQAGLINTAFYLIYGIGQFVFGVLGDKFSPFIFVGGGLFTSAVMNLIMYGQLTGGAGFPIMLVVWAVNGMAQSALWSPIIRILSTMLPHKIAVAACSNMMIACTIGTVGSYPLSTLLMKTAGWQTVFLIPGIVLSAASAVWFISSALLHRGAHEPSGNEHLYNNTAQPEKAEISPAKRENLFILLYKSGILFIIPAVLFMGMIKEGSSSWTPIIINELFSMSPADSVLITTIIPLVSSAGAVIARRMHERLHFNSMYACALYFAAIVVSDFIMLTLGMKFLPVMLLTLCSCTIFALALNTVHITIIPVHFAKYGYSGTVCGLLNSISAFAYSLSSAIIGTVQPYIGWSGCITAWIAMSVVSVVFQAAVGKRWKQFAASDA